MIEERLLEDATERYLEFWMNEDSDFHKYISDATKPMYLRRNMLSDCLSRYKIARNVQPQAVEFMNYDYGGCGSGMNPAKHEKILYVLDAFETSDCWANDVLKLNSKLIRALDNKVGMLSLSSKVLWQKCRGSNLVFDDDARTALNTPLKDIHRFHAKWEALYKMNLPVIKKLVNEAVNSEGMMIPPYRLSEYESDWFYRRVLDNYLIHAGRQIKASKKI